MKKLSKLVALALACVMALTMLTACGGKNYNGEILKVINATAQQNSHTPVKRNAELDKVAKELLPAAEAYNSKTDLVTYGTATKDAFSKVGQMTIDGGKIYCLTVMSGSALPQGSFGQRSIFATANVDYVGIASGTVNGHFVYVVVCANKR